MNKEEERMENEARKGEWEEGGYCLLQPLHP